MSVTQIAQSSHSIRGLHILLAILFVAFAIADSGIMHRLLAMGAIELNPIVSYFLHLNEMGFWYAKILFAVGAMTLFLFLSRKYPSQIGKILITITTLISFTFSYDLLGFLLWQQ